MNNRDILIGLITTKLTFDDCTYNCKECKYEKETYCQSVRLADYLIDNGVNIIKNGLNKSKNGFLCSECSFGDFGMFNKYSPNYCPNCGAKMEVK